MSCEFLSCERGVGSDRSRSLRDDNKKSKSYSKDKSQYSGPFDCAQDRLLHSA